MKHFLLALTASVMVLVSMTSQSASIPPFEAVRPVSVDGDNNCSAVVLQRNVAITARHCVQPGMEIDGLEVESVITSAQYHDVAVVVVPGLACPCAELGVRPKIGDQVIAGGFRGDHNGERAISPVGRVAYVGKMRDYFKNLPVDDPMGDEDYIITDSAIISFGDSGGALFSMQNGEWCVVGIVNFVVPDLDTCSPFGCEKYIASGFAPIDVMHKILNSVVDGILQR